MPARVESTSPLAGLSPVAGKPLITRFAGGQLSSDGGLLALREVEGVVRVRVTPKTKNPFTVKALSISGVTLKRHVLNHALLRIRLRSRPCFVALLACEVAGVAASWKAACPS